MNYPQRDDLVVVKVGQILDYGVFVELLEYHNAKGFVHISNVSSSWVKNIRNFVKPNQVRVAKVLNVDLAKKQIDLSFAGVSSSRERQKINEFRQFNREEKLIDLLAKQSGKKFDDVWQEVAEPLSSEYGSLLDAFEKIALGEDVSKIIDSKWVVQLRELVEKNVVVSKKTLRGKIVLHSMDSNGVDLVKTILKEAESIKGCEVSYIGSGQYSISCSSYTFKDAEKIMNKAVNASEAKAKALGAQFEFKREEEK